MSPRGTIFILNISYNSYYKLFVYTNTRSLNTNLKHTKYNTFFEKYINSYYIYKDQTYTLKKKKYENIFYIQCYLRINK